MKTYTHQICMRFLSLLFLLSCALPAVGKKKPDAVTITAPSLTNLCVGSVTYTNLGSIIIAGATTDITNGNNETMVLTMPAGFELEAGQGSTSIQGGGNIDNTTVTASTITIQYDAVGATTGFTITGLRVRATSGGSGNLIFTSSTAAIVGTTAGTTVMASFSTANPVVPTITGGNIKNYCIGSSTATTITASGSGTLKWYSNVALTTEITPIATPTAPTLAELGVSTATANTKLVYVVSDVSGCQSTATAVTINVNASPTLNVFPTATTICQGQTITFVGFSGTGTQYEFVLKKGGVTQLTQAFSATQSFVTSNALVAGNDYSMEVKTRDVGSCESTVNTTNFTINALPAPPSITGGSTFTYCVGDNMTTPILTATGVVGNTFDWFSDASLTPPALANTASVTPAVLGVSSASATTYLRYVTQKNVNCRSTATLVTIQIIDKPIVVLSASLPPSNQICAGNAVTFTASGSAGVQYRFERLLAPATSQDLTSFSATSTYVTPTSLPAGNYLMRVTGRNANNCETTTADYAFEILAKPSVVFPTPVPDNYIETQTTPVTLTATPLGGTYTGAGMVGNQFYPNLAGAAGPKVITYTFTNASGCTDSQNITITVNPSGFFIAGLYCGDAGVSPMTSPAIHLGVPCGDATAVFPINGSSPAFVSGSAPNFFANPSLVPIPLGQDFVQWEGVGQTQFCGGGFGGFYISTYIFRSPNPVFTGSNNVCETQDITYSVPLVAGNTYAWSILPSSAGNIISGAGTNSITIKWLQTGSHQVRVTQVANYTTPLTTSCSKTVDYGVTVNALPTPSITTTSASVCENSTGHTYSMVATPANRTYAWSVSANGTITSTVAPTSTSITVSWGGAGAGTVTVVETNTVTNCAKTFIQNVTINALPNPDFTVVNVCEGLTGVSYTTNANAGSTYIWTIQAGRSTNILNANTNTVTLDWNLGFTSATVEVEETNVNGCKRKVTKTVIFNTRPTATISNVIGLFGNFACRSSAGNQYTTGADATTYAWTVTNGTITSGAGTNTVTIAWNNTATGTIAVTKTNVNGCINSVSEIITLNAPPVASITGANSVCQGGTTTYTAANPSMGHTYAWSVTGGTINGSATGSSISVTWTTASPGTGIVNFTQTSDVAPTLCSHSTTLNVAMLALPTPAISGNGVTASTFACENTTGVTYQTLGVVGSNYEWTLSGGGSITSPASAPYNSNIITINWAGAGSRTLTLKETNANGCQTTVSATIDVKSRPTPNIFGSSEVCASSVDMEYFTPNTGNTYTWTVNSGGTISANLGEKIRVNWGTGTTGLITLVETNPVTGCNQTTTRNITIRPLPTPTITGDNDICATDAGVAYQVAAVAGHAYTWTVTGGAIATGQNTNSITVNWGAAGVGTVSVQQVDNNFATACPTSTTLTVTINSLPTPAITGDLTVCANVAGKVYTTPTVTNHTYMWTVVGGTIIGTNTNNTVTVDWGASLAGSVSVEQTSPVGCKFTDTKNIVILPLPTPSVAGSLEVCANQTSPNDYPYTYSTSLVTGHTYFWTITGGTIMSGQNTNQVVVAWNTGAGTGTLRVTQTSNTSPACTFFNQKTIVIRDLPEPVIAGNAQVCAEDKAVAYQVAALPNHTYQWIVTGGIIASGTGTNAITVDWGTGASGTVQVRVQNTGNPANCSKGVVLPITINPLPTPDIVGAFTICANSTNNTYLVANTPNHSYVWTVVNGTITAGQGTNQIQVTWNANASGSVSILQTNTITGCIKVNAKNIVILPLPNPSIVGNLTVCASTNAINFYEYNYSTTPVAGNIYFWTVTNGTITTGQSTNQITVRWNSGSPSGTIRVTQTSATIPACTFFEQRNITINIVPVTDITMANFCFNDNTTFIPTITDPTWEWDWRFSDGSTATTPSVTKQFVTAGAKNFSLTVKNALGCEYKITKNFDITPIPVPAFDYLGSCKNTVMQFTDKSTLPTVFSTDKIAKWTWDFGDATTLTGTDPLVHKNPTKLYTATGLYTVKLTVETDRGCSREISQTVSIYPSFTPTTANPYLQEFKGTNGGWIPAGTNSSWKLGRPTANRTVKVIAPNDSIWSTGLDANYTNAQSSHIESPCFDIRTLDRPHIAMKIWNDSDAGSDGTVLLVTHNDGQTWELVGDVNEGMDWYNATNILGAPGTDAFNPLKKGWSGKDTGWKVARFPLDVVKQKAITTGQPIRLRIAFASNLDNPAGTLDGVAIDSIYIGSRNRIVLLEHFTSGSTDAQIVNANNFINTFPGTQEEIVKVQYHTNFLGNDQLNKDNPAEPSARALYYGVNTASRGAIDGTPNVQAPLSSWGLPIYNRRVLVPSPFNIALTFPNTPANQFNIQANITAIRPMNRPLIVHTLVIENEIDGTAVNIPSVPKFRNVVKKMLPNAAGTFTDGAWAVGVSRTFNQSWTIYNVAQSTGSAPKIYDLSKLEVIVFIQDDITKEVYQSIRVKPNTAPPTVLASEPTLKLPQLKLYPNPAEEIVTLDLGESLKDDCTWELVNTLGVVVGKGELQKGIEKAQIQTAQYPRGMYLVRITQARQKQTATYKLILR